MQEDHKIRPFERGTPKVVIVLIQAFSCLQGFVKQSCNVVAPFSISSATMLPSILTYLNRMSPLLV